MADSTDLAGLDIFAQALRKSPEAANKAAEVALNEGADKALNLGIAQILSELNLEKGYVQKHLTVNKRARRHDLLSRVSANRRSVLATRYGAAVAMVPTKTRRKHHKGDPYRRIPKGMKAAGSTAWRQQRGGGGTAWANAFFVYGRSSHAWMMVVRKTKAKDSPLRSIYGTSVDQAWKSVRTDVTPEAMKVVVKVFQKEFKRFR